MCCGWLRLVVIHYLHFFNRWFRCTSRLSFLDVYDDPILGLLLLELEPAAERTTHDDYDNDEKYDSHYLEYIDWF